MTNLREKYINIISRCNCKEIRHNWINELRHNTDIECTESQCTGCLIAKDCLEVCNNKSKEATNE